MTAPQEHTLKLRTGQRAFSRFTYEHRLTAFVARRQYGKTVTLSGIALRKMMKTPGHTVIFGSAKLNLSREIVRKEADVLQKAIAAFGANPLLGTYDAATGKQTHLTPDDFAEQFEAQRLEFRYYHDNTTYSRTKVVALRPDTVGETGDLMCDEIGRIANWREVWEAVEPIVASNPTFRLILSTTPPPDDTHYSFSMLAPPVGAEFPVNPAGNTYRTDSGVWVLRLDAFDAWADNVAVYDLDTGKPLPPEAHRQRSMDKDAWDRNYGCKFIVGGSAACGLIQLDGAQQRGVGTCAFFAIDSDSDFQAATTWLEKHVSPDSPVGLGVDVATTEKESSNPTAVAVMERMGINSVVRAIFLWKTRDPAIARERLSGLLRAIERRPGGRPRKLCIDATSERYFATELQRHLAAQVPVELVIASETVLPPGYSDTVTMKTWLGDRYVAELDDNHLTLPPERYVREDHRLPKKIRGAYVCEADPEGRHGDTFDACKLALHALLGPNAGPIMVFEGTRCSQILTDRRTREVVA